LTTDTKLPVTTHGRHWSFLAAGGGGCGLLYTYLAILKSSDACLLEFEELG
jgi:hypothetical protein